MAIFFCTLGYYPMLLYLVAPVVPALATRALSVGSQDRDFKFDSAWSDQ